MKHIKFKILAGFLAISLLMSPLQVSYAAFLGDSEKVVFGEVNFNGENDMEAFLKSAIFQEDSSTQEIRSSTSGFLIAPRFSADGQKMTFSEDGGEETSIYIANSDGSDATKLTMSLNFEEETVDISNMSMFSSFHPDGQKIIFNVTGYIGTVDINGENVEAISDIASQRYCSYAPVYSPDGSKIAFFRGDKDENNSGIYIMNADGTGVVELERISDTEASCGESALLVAFGIGFEGNLATAVDWSPDGSKILFATVEYDENEMPIASRLVTTDLLGETQTVKQYTGSEGNVALATNPQFTPEGDVLYKLIQQQEDVFSSSLYSSGPDGLNDVLLVPEVSSTDNPESIMFAHLTPTIQPTANTDSEPNQVTLQNPETNSTVLLETPEGTEITCSSAASESAQIEQDESYDYPLGLVRFCFDTGAEDNEVTLTFVTDLKPDEVKARKYNSTNNTYFDIPNATITQTTLEDQPALALTYTITDNGQLDLNPETGKIVDPVGLAVGGDLASTGESQLAIFMLVAVMVLPLGYVTIQRNLNTRLSSGT